MKELVLVLFLSHSFAHQNNLASRLTHLDLLIEDLQNEHWEKDDLHCYNQIITTLQNAKNGTLWATWVLDSIQFPTGILYGSKYQLGNYDECLKPPWLNTHPQLRNKYCLADVKLTQSKVLKRREFSPYESAESYINTRTKHARTLNTITWGVCVPSSCTPKSTTVFLRSLLRISTLGSLTDTDISVDECQVAGDVDYGTGYYVFWYLLLLLLLICIACTWLLASTNYGTKDCKVSKLAKCFCMNSNAYELVKPIADEIPALNGMRAMSALIFAFTHHIFFLNSGAVVNGLDVDEYMDLGSFVLHTDLLTDTFLLMSGLLLAKGLVAKQNLENPILTLWKRYIRLIGPIALIVWYMSAVSVQSGDGPMWPRLEGYEQETCRRNWWLTLLMANNYVNSEDMCFIILWYVQADYQLTILGVALIYLYRGHRRLGVAAAMTVAILAVVLPAWATYWQRLPATIIYNVATMINIRQNREFITTYIRSHYRIGTYLFGLAMGYLLTKYKPASYRNVISKKWSILGFIIMFISAWTPMAMAGVFYTREYDAMEAAIFAATNRLVWVASMGSLIVICEYGDLPIINRLLCWKPWVPLSRLSYALYLTHAIVIFYNVYSARAPRTVKPITMLSDSFGPIVIGYILSLLVWLLVQAPINNLTNLWYSKKQPPRKTVLEDNTSKTKLTESDFTEKNKIQ